MTNSIVANKSKPGTTSKSETSSINGENESSQGEQHHVDGGKENKQDTVKNKKKKGKLSLIFLLKSGSYIDFNFWLLVLHYGARALQKRQLVVWTRMANTDL